MSSFKLRQELLSDAGLTIASDRERRLTDIDPLTGENWEGTQRHNKHMDFIYRVAAADVDPAPTGENTSDTAIDKIKDLVRRVSVGEISPMLAEHYLRPLMVLIDLTELAEIKAMLIKANLDLNLNNNRGK